MPKKVFRVCFLVFILLSLTQISHSEPNETNQTISSDPSELLLDSAPSSIQETPPPENSSLLSNDTAPALEFEDQTLSPQYSKDATPEALAEPDFFSPENYSTPPSPEALFTQPEIQPELDQNSQINASVPAQSTDFQLPETETVTSLPEVELDQANVNNSQMIAAGPAPSAELTLPEVEDLSAGPKVEPEADDGNESPTEVSASAPSGAITLPEMDANSTLAAPLDEEVNDSPVSPSSLPNNQTTEDTDIKPPETEANGNNSTVSDTSVDFTLPEVNDETTSPISGSDDENVNMPSMAHNPPDSPFTYVAEDETYDIVYEEDKDSWGSWAGDNPLVVAGGVIGVCFVGLAGLVYSNGKKKKTQFQYQSLSKGI